MSASITKTVGIALIKSDLIAEGVLGTMGGMILGFGELIESRTPELQRTSVISTTVNLFVRELFRRPDSAGKLISIGSHSTDKRHLSTALPNQPRRDAQAL